MSLHSILKFCGMESQISLNNPKELREFCLLNSEPKGASGESEASREEIQLPMEAKAPGAGKEPRLRGESRRRATDERTARKVTGLSGFSLARFPTHSICGSHSRDPSVLRAERVGGLRIRPE